MSVIVKLGFNMGTSVSKPEPKKERVHISEIDGTVVTGANKEQVWELAPLCDTPCVPHGERFI